MPNPELQPIIPPTSELKHSLTEAQTDYLEKLNKQLLELTKGKGLEHLKLDDYPVETQEKILELGETIEKVARGEIKREFTSPEKAKEILGPDFLGPEEIKKAFNIELKPEDVSEIPFSQEDLERAKELGQFLVLRTDKAPDGEPLTMEKLNNLLQPTFDQENKGKVLFGISQYYNEDFFKKETPKPRWALVSREAIPDSTNKNYLQQTEVIIDYLKNQVFSTKGGSASGGQGQEIPKEYQEAIQEFETKKPEIQKLIQDDWQKAAEMLENLKITQLTRQSPTETLYDLLLYFQNNQERILKDRYTWTKRRSSDGDLVDAGGFDARGAHVVGWEPGIAYDDLGLSLSRSL